jgi:hypothetical protein
MPDDINVIAAEVKALAGLIDNRILRDIEEIKTALFKMSNGLNEAGIAGRETHRMVVKVDQHEDRLTRLERVYWLQVGLYGLLAPVLIWFIIRLVAGTLP